MKIEDWTRADCGVFFYRPHDPKAPLPPRVFRMRYRSSFPPRNYTGEGVVWVESRGDGIRLIDWWNRQPPWHYEIISIVRDYVPQPALTYEI